MPTASLNVFRIPTLPKSPFAYLGAMWTIEIIQVDEHWECATTAPLKLTIAMAESRAALLQELQSGIASSRYSQLWCLLNRLVELGLAEKQ